jgi:hypothetical protein
MDLRVSNLSCFALSLLSLVFGHGGAFVVVIIKQLGLVEVSGVCADDLCEVLLLPCPRAWWAIHAFLFHGFDSIRQTGWLKAVSSSCCEADQMAIIRDILNSG